MHYAILGSMLADLNFTMKSRSLCLRSNFLEISFNIFGREGIPSICNYATVRVFGLFAEHPKTKNCSGVEWQILNSLHCTSKQL